MINNNNNNNNNDADEDDISKPKFLKPFERVWDRVNDGDIAQTIADMHKQQMRNRRSLFQQAKVRRGTLRSHSRSHCWCYSHCH